MTILSVGAFLGLSWLAAAARIGVDLETDDNADRMSGAANFSVEGPHKADDSYNCGSVVAGAVTRDGSWYLSESCKCPYDWVIKGEASVCKGRTFHPNNAGLKAAGCHCESPSPIKNFIPIGEMVPTMDPYRDCPVEYGFSDCPAHAGLPDLASNLHKWCRDEFVPEEKRMPKQLQGFLWMYKDYLDDVGMCTSLAEWDKETLTATLAPWTHFVFQKLPDEKYAHDAKRLAFRPVVGGRLIYYLKFKDSSLSYANIWTNSKLQNALIDFPLIQIPETPDGKMKGPGIYHRPSYFGALPYYTGAGGNVMDYYAVKIMDGEFNIFEDRYKLMMEEECEWNVKHNNGTTSTTIVHYPSQCPGMEKGS